LRNSLQNLWHNSRRVAPQNAAQDHPHTCRHIARHTRRETESGVAPSYFSRAFFFSASAMGSRILASKASGSQDLVR
jgi:hypothetical protein